ncbi:zinc-binding protein A33-like [Amblyraja radiata]|uniref:zinc-binding protein A33-like n=1 Tax=Amblyraja radiata TaxID=386614 RepID=UPI00140233F1|nr:zinc-binding protein A33-like [Amblyraja radiata]
MAESLVLNIAAEFSTLHQFLNEEEQQMKGRLKEDVERISQQLRDNLRKITEKRASIEHTILEIQQRLDVQETAFLADVKSLIERSYVKFKKPAEVPLNLLLGEFGGPLQLIIWRRMLNIISPGWLLLARLPADLPLHHCSADLPARCLHSPPGCYWTRCTGSSLAPVVTLRKVKVKCLSAVSRLSRADPLFARGRTSFHVRAFPALGRPPRPGFHGSWLLSASLAGLSAFLLTVGLTLILTGPSLLSSPTGLTVPATAHPELLLSTDLCGVCLGDTWREVPNNPERFDDCVSVLSTQGFSSGRHYWQVEVGGKTMWDVGLCRESVSRKGSIILSPDDGFWTIWLRNGSEYEALSTPSALLSLPARPTTIGVFLDYDGGHVSFYNADDMSLIYTFSDTFSERLFPYFSPGESDGGKNAQPLRLCGLRL